MHDLGRKVVVSGAIKGLQLLLGTLASLLLARWLGATRSAISSCECAAGCPSCVHSPKCGNGNHPLDKDGAIRVLSAVLAAVDPGSGG